MNNNIFDINEFLFDKRILNEINSISQKAQHIKFNIKNYDDTIRITKKSIIYNQLYDYINSYDSEHKIFIDIHHMPNFSENQVSGRIYIPQVKYKDWEEYFIIDIFCNKNKVMAIKFLITVLHEFAHYLQYKYDIFNYETFQSAYQTELNADKIAKVLFKSLTFKYQNNHYLYKHSDFNLYKSKRCINFLYKFDKGKYDILFK